MSIDQTAVLNAYTHRLNAKPGETLEDDIAYYARVSNPTSQANAQNSAKLNAYLIRHAHWSPFDMCNIVLDVTTSRDIGRQTLRHHSFRFQEFSQRYSATETLSSQRELRMQDHNNRQNSLPTDDEDLKKWWAEAQKEVARFTFEMYDKALKKDVAKEVARVILPEGLTHTRYFQNGTVRSWIHYIMTRTHESSQKEHRELALACANAIKPIFPSITTFYAD
jgi:thymidylate synthase (FAD)